MIEDVINDVRDIFLDDGVDEQVLMELKTVSLPFFFAFLTLFIQKRYSHYFSYDDHLTLLQEAV